MDKERPDKEELDEYEIYDRECKKIKAKNKKLIKIFKDEMAENNLPKKTIKDQASDVDFFLNEFLLREDPIPMEEGASNLNGFFSYVIRKCMWSTPENIETMADSLKKFYKCMMDHGEVDEDLYEIIEEEIDSRVRIWQIQWRAWNDPNKKIESVFDIFF